MVNSSILQLLKNKYLLTGLIFVLWMFFLDKDDILSSWNLDHKLSEVSSQRDYYLKAIEKVKNNLKDLDSHPELLEKLAREKYYMKKDQEDLFVMIPAPKSPSKRDSFFSKIRSIFSKPIQKK